MYFVNSLANCKYPKKEKGKSDDKYSWFDQTDEKRYMSDIEMLQKMYIL